MSCIRPLSVTFKQFMQVNVVTTFCYLDVQNPWPAFTVNFEIYKI